MAMNKKNKLSLQQADHTENIIVWKSNENTSSEGNLIRFPSNQEEATYQEVSIKDTSVKLKIISSGFGSGRSFSSASLQLAA
jgi:hypothetical protein